MALREMDLALERRAERAAVSDAMVMFYKRRLMKMCFAGAVVLMIMQWTLFRVGFVAPSRKLNVLSLTHHWRRLASQAGRLKVRCQPDSLTC